MGVAFDGEESPMKSDQAEQFMLQSLEHEMGGAKVYQAAAGVSPLLEDFLFDDASDDMATAMALPAVRRYLAQDHGGDTTDVGFRSLVEHPEALSRSLRGQLQ
jgi:hypothetical protein